MSMRVRMGKSHALENDGIWTARSSCSMSASHVMGWSSGQYRASRGLSHDGAHLEYQRALCSVRHAVSGLSTTVVSTMLMGAGSVAVSDFSVDALDFWELVQQLVLDLQILAGFGNSDPRQRDRHVKDEPSFNGGMN